MRVILVLVYALWVTSAHSPGYDPRNHPAIKTTRQLFDQLQTVFGKAFTASERSRLGENVWIQMREDDLRIVSPDVAAMDDGSRRIRFTLGTLMALSEMNAAYAFVMEGRAATPILAEYPTDAFEAARSGDKLLLFRDWARSTIPDCQERLRNPDFPVTFIRASYGAMAFLYGHELGHIVLGHLDHRPASTVAIERDADRFALDLMARANVNPLLGRGAYALARFLAPDVPGVPEDVDHPPIPCREFWARLEGSKIIASRPAEVEGYKRRGQWEQLHADLLDMIANPEPGCE